MGMSERQFAGESVIIPEAEKLLTVLYGPGNNPVEPRIFHNVEQSREVVLAAAKIGRLAFRHERIARDHILLGKIAAIYHRAVQLHPDPERNLEGSIEVATASMHTKPPLFTDTDRKIVEACIVAAQPGQDPELLEWDLDEKDIYLTRIVSDASHAHQGMPPADYFDRAVLSYIEANPGIRVEDATAPQFAGHQLSELQRFSTTEAGSIYPWYETNVALIHDVRDTGILPSRDQLEMLAQAC
jgi:hypothetical protein